MKKLTSLILALTLILGLSMVMPLEISAAPFDGMSAFPQAIAESFEGGVPSTVSANNAVLSPVSSVRGVATKAMNVVPSAAGNSVYFAFGGKKSNVYNVSFLYKNIDLSNLKLNVYFKTSSGSYKYHTVALTNDTAVGDWSKAKATFTDHSEDLRIGYIELLSNVNTVYCLDDVLVSPVPDTGIHKSHNFITASTFDTSSEVDEWKRGSWSLSGRQWDREYKSDSAAVGGGSMRIYTNGRGWDACSLSVELPADRTYEVSFWAKANNATTADGNTIKLVVDRTGDTSGAISTYTYVTLEDSTLTTEWRLYKGTYTQTTDAAANAIVNIYPRVCETNKDSVDYSIDEIVFCSENLVPVSSFDMPDQYNNFSTPGVTVSAGEGKVGAHSMRAVSTGSATSYSNIFQTVDVRSGRSYNISFWAKANNDLTVGKSIRLLFTSYTINEAGDEVVSYPSVRDENNPTLTADWVHYNMTYTPDKTTISTTTPRMTPRVGEGVGTEELIDYCMDELIITEVPNSYKLDTGFSAYGNAYAGAIVTVKVSANYASAGAYYKLYATENDENYELINGGYVANGESSQHVLPTGTTACKLEYNMADAFGRVGPTQEYYLSEGAISTVELSRVNFDTSIWVTDMPTLDATVEFQSAEHGRDIFAALALYDKDNMLVSSDVDDTASLSTIESTTLTLSAKNDSTAVMAKIFLWEKGSNAPLRAVKEMEKTASDYFIYVDPVNGKASAAGTFSAPVKTINQGRTKMNSLANAAKASGVDTSITLVLMPGTYNNTISFTATNTPVADNVQLNFVSYKTKEAVISGGTKIEGFTLYDSNKNIYRAATDLVSRQLYVDGVRATRARSEGGLKDAVNLGKNGTGLTTTDTSFMSYKNIQDLEFVFYEAWINLRYKVDSVTQDNSTGLVTLHMNEQLWQSSFATTGHTQNDPTIPHFYENAYELLDKPGEFYFGDGYLYYIPRAHENLNSAEVIVPTSDSLLSMSGTTSAPMKNIKFDGLSFKYTTWMDPENGGIDPGQNNTSARRLDSSGTIVGTSIPAALELANVHNVDFYNCEISKIGQVGIRYTNAVQGCDFVGNELADISANGLILGICSYETAYESDTTKQIRNCNITDNYIHDIAWEYSSGAAVSAAFPINTEISHNEIYNTMYSGMHIGYGWGGYQGTVTKNLHLNNNYIHDVFHDGKMSDGGGIYTLGGTGGSLDDLNEMCGNYIYDVGNAYGALYPDEGSSHWLLENNVVDLTTTPLWVTNHGNEVAPRWTHIHTDTINNLVYGTNYSTTAEYYNVGTDIQYQAPEVYPTAKWPTAAKNIINNAGIRDEYKDNFDFGVQEVVAYGGVLSVGDSQALTYYPTTTKFHTYDLSDAHVYFKSMNPNILTVNNSGQMSAVAKGTAIVKITVVDGAYARTFDVEVTVS